MISSDIQHIMDGNGYKSYITHRGGNQNNAQLGVKFSILKIEPLLNKPISAFNNIYKPINNTSYMFITHSLNNFLGERCTKKIF